MTGHYSRRTLNKQDWETPQTLVNFIEDEYRVFFSLDVAATDDNKKAPMFFDEEMDGLKRSWYSHTVWCNPPYENQKDWVLKAIHEAARNEADVFMLIPARPDTKLFHDWIMTNASSIAFIKGRINFMGAERTNKGGASFPVMVVRFNRRAGGFPTFLTLEPDKIQRGVREKTCANDTCRRVLSKCDGRRMVRCAKCVRLEKEAKLANMTKGDGPE